MKRGVVLGKFMPLHLGHEHMINTAIQACDQVIVVVCTLSSEPIDGKLRYQWMRNRFSREIANCQVNVVHLDEDWIPQTPEDCHSPAVFYGTWAGTLKALAGAPIDVIFTSEEYGYPVAQYLECEHVMVDQPRRQVPVSGTAIRNNPIANWSYMNKNVRRHFAKKVLILGAESTGKSTLTDQLGNYYSQQGIATKAIQEYAREWIDNHLEGDMERLRFEHITLFGNTQMELVKQAQMHEDRQLILTDTDAITSMIFQQIYYGEVDPLLRQIAEDETWDLILLTCPDVPWVDDGQRNLGHRRAEVHAMFQQTLEQREWKYVEIRGNWQGRFSKATKAIDLLLGI